MQELILAILFAGAILFIGKRVRDQYVKKDSCDVNCGCESPVRPKP